MKRVTKEMQRSAIKEFFWPKCALLGIRFLPRVIFWNNEIFRKVQMNDLVNAGLRSMEGRTFILGREGHIYIGDPSVSKQHAELKIIDGRIQIRDLGSTNGVYLIKDNKPVRFQQDFVEPDQTIAIGYQRETVQSLLAIIRVFAD